MTPLRKPVSRLSNTALDGSYGPDRNKRITITLIPGNGKDVPDLFELRPERTRRPERIAVADVYRYALRCRVGRELLEKARARKTKLETRRATARLNYAEAKLRRPL